MIGAPNTQGQKYWLGIVQRAPETSVSEEIANIFRNYNIDIEVIVVSLTTWGRWWSSQVVNETTMTEIEASISILSWWNQINDE